MPKVEREERKKGLYLAKVGKYKGRKTSSNLDPLLLGTGNNTGENVVFPLFRLPRDVLLYVMNEYLKHEDICRLDIAVSSKKFRAVLIDCLQYHTKGIKEYSNSNNKSKYSDSSITTSNNKNAKGGLFLNWAAARKLALDALICSPHAQSSNKADDITNTSMRKIAKFGGSLKSLHLLNCRNISGTSLLSIAEQCLQMVSLTLENCDGVNDTFLQKLAPFACCYKELKFIALSFVTNVGMVALLSQCKQLECCFIQKCHHVTSVTLISLFKSCPKLKILNLEDWFSDNMETTTKTSASASVAKLNYNNATTATINGQGNETSLQLEQLQLARCTKLTNLTLRHWCQQANIHVRVLDISCCNLLDDQTMAVVTKHCPYITSLNISHCNGFTARSIDYITERYCFYLHTIVLSSCQWVDSSVIDKLTYSCRKLTTLVVGTCMKFDDHCLQLLIQAVTSVVNNSTLSLTSLDLSHCPITTLPVLSLLRGCGNQLITLCLCSCNMLSDEVVKEIAVCCPNIVSLDLGALPKLTIGSVYSLLITCTKLRYLQLSVYLHLYASASTTTKTTTTIAIKTTSETESKAEADCVEPDTETFSEEDDDESQEVQKKSVNKSVMIGGFNKNSCLTKDFVAFLTLKFKRTTFKTIIV